MSELFRFFDPDEDVAVTARRLPHWAQAGALCFLTWRTWDSIPAPALDSWFRTRSSWLAGRNISPTDPHWRERVRGLTEPERCEFHRTVSTRWHELLDCCEGECVLRRPELAGIVAASIRYFDGDRYRVTDFVVMPNHVHLLVSFPSETQMLAQCESWKHYTAVRLNKALGRKGRFWQVDGFDHLVRSDQQFDVLRDYIATNPVRAKLRSGEFVHYALALDPFEVGDALRA
ncbi:transposase [Frigoriglobus tundricola]|uniref:Type I restriction-modification system, restriction subunit R n=1 Tax=Frigoriglobus tundricola TaxID=2774151 RepID=A0A6M5YXK2_9BACT|nr:transposase [Frigoriglobus tundricola]QJW98214.1 Type I restriction-modification system, restriction subunit R [Frigoriglobus tundricola]